MHQPTLLSPVGHQNLNMTNGAVWWLTLKVLKPPSLIFGLLKISLEAKVH